MASRKDYVKYTDSFYTRSHVSFDEGNIVIETQQDLNRLHNAIVHTLLMGAMQKVLIYLHLVMCRLALAHSFWGRL